MAISYPEKKDNPSITERKEYYTMKKAGRMLLSFMLILAIVFSVGMFRAEAASKDNISSEHTYRVMVINFDPVFPSAGNKRQHELLDPWNDPRELAAGFAADMNEISHGYCTYTIMEWIDLNEMPRSTSGQAYDVDEYYDTLMAADKAMDGAYWQDPRWEDWGFEFDYDYYLSRYTVYDRVKNGEIDEVWIFTGPMVGVTLYETRMIGKGAYWCNSPGLEKDCPPFVVYGFNYEREVGEMLEDAGHRAESILSEVFGEWNFDKPYDQYTDWEKFSAYDQVSPGNAGVGNVHFAPNSIGDYDWGNPSFVYSNCNDWANYPNMEAAPERVNCATWGDGDTRLHHKWWFSLFPHADGINDASKMYNNWWIYFTLDYIKDPPQ